MSRFTDSHCHLTMADADAVLLRARDEGVRGFVVPATKLDDAPESASRNGTGGRTGPRLRQLVDSKARNLACSARSLATSAHPVGARGVLQQIDGVRARDRRAPGDEQQPLWMPPVRQ